MCLARCTIVSVVLCFLVAVNACGKCASSSQALGVEARELNAVVMTMLRISPPGLPSCSKASFVRSPTP